MKNKINLIFLEVLLFIIISLNINAAGVSSPYWDENPMYVQPGEIKEFSYTLQNMVGNEDITLKAEIEAGSDIMEFVDEDNLYEVPFGRSDVVAKMKITVPKNAKEGDEWSVGVKFTTATQNVEGKPLAIGSAFSKGFKVIVGKKPEPLVQVIKEGSKESPQFLTLLISLGVLIILVFLVKYLYKKKE